VVVTNQLLAIIKISNLSVPSSYEAGGRWHSFLNASPLFASRPTFWAGLDSKPKRYSRWGDVGVYLHDGSASAGESPLDPKQSSTTVCFGAMQRANRSPDIKGFPRHPTNDHRTHQRRQPSHAVDRGRSIDVPRMPQLMVRASPPH
jgi:hypothetical protein